MFNIVFIPISLSLLFHCHPLAFLSFYLFITYPFFYFVFYHVRFSYSFSLPSFLSFFVAALSILIYLAFSYSFPSPPCLSLPSPSRLSYLMAYGFFFCACFFHPRLATSSLPRYLVSPYRNNGILPHLVSHNHYLSCHSYLLTVSSILTLLSCLSFIVTTVNFFFNFFIFYFLFFYF